ncbi:MAG: YukJ family protein [Janthinobacterium lividum]
MSIANYSVLRGHPVTGKVVSGASAHYQITVDALDRAGQPFTVAVNIESVDGSEVLYAIKTGFTVPDPAGLAGLASGITAVPSEPGGLALDFVRSTVAGQPMITRQEMTTLPIAKSSGSFFQEAMSLETLTSAERASHALQNAVVALLNQAVADASSEIYVFGSAFADGGVTDGIHDIHMNQGNPVNNHANENGIWQDGGLFVSLPGQGGWTALFIAFQTESWTTDAVGNPV